MNEWKKRHLCRVSLAGRDKARQGKSGSCVAWTWSSQTGVETKSDKSQVRSYCCMSCSARALKLFLGPEVPQSDGMEEQQDDMKPDCFTLVEVLTTINGSCVRPELSIAVLGCSSQAAQQLGIECDFGLLEHALCHLRGPHHCLYFQKSDVGPPLLLVLHRNLLPLHVQLCPTTRRSGSRHLETPLRRLQHPGTMLTVQI